MSCETAAHTVRAEPSGSGRDEWDFDPSLDVAADDGTLLAQVIAWYQRCLKGHQPAQAYLLGRGLEPELLLERFQLGYADRRLARRLAPPQTPAGRAVRARLQQLGVLRASGHGQLTGCLTFPLYGPDGQLVDLYGLRTARALPPGGERHVRLANQRCSQPPIFNLHQADTSRPLIVADSPLCALALWQSELTNVISLLPGHQVTEPIAQWLSDLGIKELILAMANTPSGVGAAEQAAAQLTAAGVSVHTATLPAGHDACGVLEKLGPEKLAAIVHHPVDATHRPRGAQADRLLRPAATEHPRPSEKAAAVNLLPTEESPEGPSSDDVQPTAPHACKEDSSLRSSEDEGMGRITDGESPIDQLHFTFDDRHWRVRGLEHNLSAERLKINLKVSRDGLMHVSLLDLYSAAQRRAFVRDAAEEIYTAEDLLKRDLGRLLERLEREQEQRIRAALSVQAPPEVKICEADRRQAMELLTDPQLAQRIAADLARCGLVGEQTNKQLLYLACVSRLLSRPLAVLIQSGSAAGKTTLVDAVLALMPPEATLRYSAMTGQSLYYMGQKDLAHKILAVAEEEGVAQAAYALKLLQSDGRLRIAAAGKDEHTGRHKTQEYTVQGPVMMLLTTTAEDPDRELASRCLTLRVSESPQQTAAIHARQRAEYTLGGIQAALDRDAIGRLHQNAQRLLEPYRVVIPWAERLSFRSDQTAMRRDHQKYLALIASITLLYQHQRQRDVDGWGQPYVVAALQDIELANRLAAQAFGHTLDELLPQTRRLLELVDRYVSGRAQREGLSPAQLRFTQRQLREAIGWSDFVLRTHLARLLELEYVVAWRSGRGNQRLYELVYQGQGRDGQPFVLGLAQIDQLTQGANYDGATGTPEGGFEHLPS